MVDEEEAVEEEDAGAVAGMMVRDGVWSPPMTKTVRGRNKTASSEAGSRGKKRSERRSLWPYEDPGMRVFPCFLLLVWLQLARCGGPSQ